VRERETGDRPREKDTMTERELVEEEEGRRTRKEAGGREERKRDVLVNACVRCTLFPSPMSEPRLGYFRDISFEREREEKKRRYGQKARGERRCVRACVHACVRALVCLVVESVIDLFREEAGISGLREGSVKERERESERGGNLSCRREKRRDDATMDGWMDERVVTTPACARTRRSGLLDGQRTNDRVLLRPLRPSYPKKEKEEEKKKEKLSRRSSRDDLLYQGILFHSII